MEKSTAGYEVVTRDLVDDKPAIIKVKTLGGYTTFSVSYILFFEVKNNDILITDSPKASEKCIVIYMNTKHVIVTEYSEELEQLLIDNM